MSNTAKRQLCEKLAQVHLRKKFARLTCFLAHVFFAVAWGGHQVMRLPLQSAVGSRECHR